MSSGCSFCVLPLCRLARAAITVQAVSSSLLSLFCSAHAMMHHATATAQSTGPCPQSMTVRAACREAAQDCHHGAGALPAAAEPGRCGHGPGVPPGGPQPARQMAAGDCAAAGGYLITQQISLVWVQLSSAISFIGQTAGVLLSSAISFIGRTAAPCSCSAQSLSAGMQHWCAAHPLLSTHL